MNFLTKAFSFLFRGEYPQRGYVGTGYGGVDTLAGVNVTELSALQSAAVWSSCRYISQSVGSIPLEIFKNTPSGSEKAPDHPLYQILNSSPNSSMTSVAWREAKVMHQALYGNAFSQIVRIGKRITALWPMRADLVRVVMAEGGGISYEYMTSQGMQRLAQEDVLHIPNVSLDGIIGLSPIQQTKQCMGLTLAAEAYGSSFYRNGGRPTGVLQHPGVLKPDVAKRLRESWDNIFGGPNNRGTAVLEEGMKYEAISVPPEDAQYILTRRFQGEEIARIFGVPPHKIGIMEHATFTNIEHQGIEAVVDTIRPYVVRWEQAMKKSLLSGPGDTDYYARFDLDGLLRGDVASRYAAYSAGLQNGFLSRNEVRAKEGLNKVEGGDVFLTPLNMTGTPPNVDPLKIPRPPA